MSQIYLVEDDRSMNHMILKKLEIEGYQVISFYDVSTVLQKINQSWDLMILDINLPDGSGYQVLEKLKELNSTKPVIVLTANDLETDVIKGYENGAMGYITKPFSDKVLLYKIKNILRFIDVTDKKNLRQDIWEDDYLKINFTTLHAKRNKEKLDLTPFEFQILKVFITNKNILLTRNKLLDLLWDQNDNFVEEHTLTAAISRLRKKIDHENKKYIETIYGMGYIFVGEDREK